MYLKTHNNSTEVRSVSRIKFLFRLSFALIGWFSPVYIYVRDNFQEYSRLSEQLLESRAAVGKLFLINEVKKKVEGHILTMFWQLYCKIIATFYSVPILGQ
jgi:hypothetical protein